MRNKRICFISLGNLYLCPYISKYTSLVDCEYDVIYWDRHNIEEHIDARQLFPFRFEMNEGKGKINKLLGYLKFRKYALDILKKNNYDGVILLQTSVGILLLSYLKIFLKKSYIVDVRDYTMEKNVVFYKLVTQLIRNSLYTVISSRGYECFLPKSNYVMVHNDTNIDKNILYRFQQRRMKKDKIVISYIGLIRFHEQNKKTIIKFKNDNRFLLRFIGTDALSLKGFCEKNQVNNVELIDRFPPEKTLDFYYETDIIYNLYGNNTPLLDYALSNKLYYAAKLKMPIVVCPDTYMEKISSEYGFGYVFNFEDKNACHKLFDYYNSINWDEFSRQCDKFINEVNEDNRGFNDKVKAFVNQI